MGEDKKVDAIEEEDWDFGPPDPRWVCQSCGHVDRSQKRPPGAARAPRRCPQCKSQDLVAQGH